VVTRGAGRARRRIGQVSSLPRFPSRTLTHFGVSTCYLDK
jgi:hypothetical protein